MKSERRQAYQVSNRPFGWTTKKGVGKFENGSARNVFVFLGRRDLAALDLASLQFEDWCFMTHTSGAKGVRCVMHYRQTDMYMYDCCLYVIWARGRCDCIFRK